MLTSERTLDLRPAEALDDGGGDGPASRQQRSRDRLVVAGFCLVALALEVHTISRSYWIDEAISVGIASHPLAQIPTLLRLDGSPPLWYFALHFWMLAFGSSPVATHTMSLATSVAAVPVLYWGARRLFGRTAGLAAAALAATNPFLGWYGTETRMYVLLVVLSAAAVTFAVCGLRDRRPLDALGAVVCFSAVDYTHNWGLYLTAVTGLYCLVRVLKARDSRLVWWVLGCGVAVVVDYVPWMPTLFEQAANTAAPWAAPPTIGDLFADPSNSLGGTIEFVIAPLFALGAWLTRRDRCRGTSQATTMLVTIAATTTLIGWLVSYIEPSWTVRYLAVAVGPWLLAIAGALSAGQAGRRVLVGACTAMAALSLAGALLPYPDPSYTMDNGAAIAAAAAPYLRPGDMVVVTQTEQVPVMAYYLGPSFSYYNPMGRAAIPTVVDWQHIVDRLQAARACSTIAPALNALPVGARVLEVNPLRAVGASGSAWSKAAHSQVVSVDHMIGTDPSLRPVRSFEQGVSPRPYSPLAGELFVKVAGPGACS